MSIESEKTKTLVEKTEDSLVLQNQKEIWIVFCKKNYSRTFDLEPNSEIIEFFPKTITQNKKSIKTLKGSIQIKKTYAKKNNLQEKICKFSFGSRDYLYTIVYYYQIEKELNIELCKKEINNFLNQIYFEEIKYPISEKEYKIRLWVFSLILLFFSLVLIFAIIINLKKKKNR